jgi:hypothetical protein
MPAANDEIAQAEERMKRHREQMAAAPIVDVLGVVSPSGVGAGRSGNQELWTLLMTLNPWRVPGGKLDPMVLSVNRPVTDEELKQFQSMLKPYSVVRLKVHLGKLPGLDLPEALLEEVVGVDISDAELNEKAAELQQPVQFDDSVLGTFTLDRSVDWFTSETTWLGTPVRLSLSATEPAEIESALKTAHALWNEQETWQQRIRDYAVKEMLSMKNDTWLGEDEVEVTADQFKARMTLEAVTIYPDGSFEFWHDDGDLFWGHSIQVAGGIAGGLNDAGIHG